MTLASKFFPSGQKLSCPTRNIRELTDYAPCSLGNAGKKIGGVNDNCSTFNEIDLHVVDTFASVVRQFFENSGKSGFSGLLEGKTYDLKSAHRQVPIIQEHTKFAYFSVYNRESGRRRFTV